MVIEHYSTLNGDKPVLVVLVGVGGTGSVMLTYLARIHIALKALGGAGLKVTVFDDDVVTDANIGRQAYYPSDVGFNKAVVATTRVNQAYGLDWCAVPHRFDVEHIDDVQDFQVCVSCVDSVQSRIAIQYAIKSTLSRTPYGGKHSAYWLDCGNTNRTGQVVLGEVVSEYIKTSETLPTVLDLYPNMADEEDDDAPSCSLAEALKHQDLFINPAVATSAAQILWELLRCGRIDKHGAFINLKQGKTSPLHTCNETWGRMMRN